MVLDPRKLRPCELGRVLNSTPVAEKHSNPHDKPVV